MNAFRFAEASADEPASLLTHPQRRNKRLLPASLKLRPTRRGHLRIFLPRVDDAHDLHRLRRHPIDNDVIGMDYRLASASYAARPVHIGVVGQPLGAGLDHRQQPFGRGRISFGDVAEYAPCVVSGAVAPDQLQHGFFCLALAITSRISTIT